MASAPTVPVTETAVNYETEAKIRYYTPVSQSQQINFQINQVYMTNAVRQSEKNKQTERHAKSKQMGKQIDRQTNKTKDRQKMKNLIASKPININ